MADKLKVKYSYTTLAITALLVLGMASWTYWLGNGEKQSQELRPVLLGDSSIYLDKNADFSDGQINTNIISGFSEKYNCSSDGSCSNFSKISLNEKIATSVAQAQSSGVNLKGVDHVLNYPVVIPNDEYNYNDDNTGVVYTFSPATFRYIFTVPASGQYNISVQTSNHNSSDLTKGPNCVNESDNNEACVPQSYRKHIFSGIKVFQCTNEACTATSETVSPNNVTVDALPSVQGWSVNAGLLEKGKKYLFAFNNVNDFSKTISIGGETYRYDYNIAVHSIGINPLTSQTNIESVGGKDVIGIRAFSNPNFQSLYEWYQVNVPNPGTPTETTINGFPALMDGRSVYIMGFNMIDESQLESWGMESSKINQSDSINSY